MPDEDKMASFKSERTEEVTDIIERMPTTFARWITFIVLFIVLLIVVSGWTIRYPDVVTGQITLNSTSSPLTLVANSSGKLKLNHFISRDQVEEGDYLAVIQNPANTADVCLLDSVLNIFNPKDSFVISGENSFPKELSLGGMNVKYYAFLSALNEMVNYRKKNLFEKQEYILMKLETNQEELLQENYEEKNIQQKNLKLQAKAYRRDSLLHDHKVIADAAFEKSKMELLSTVENLQSLSKGITSNLYRIENARNQLQQLDIQKFEKQKEIKLALLNTYYALKEEISLWEQKYVLKSPIKGKVEFLQFWREDQFVQAGEDVFAIVPQKTRIIGQVLLPEQGSGKVKLGQEVIIKLDNYPYIEYGSIKGIVKSISMVTNSQQPVIAKGKQTGGVYLVQISLPNGLKTNYGKSLPFKFEIKGTAEIITKDRRLIERLFDNLKYIVSDKK